MPVTFQYDVFLSHSAKDKPVVRELAARLKKDGIRVWLDEEQIMPGDSIPAKIEEGLEHSRVLVLCMSANAFGSGWARLEAGTFQFRDPLNQERRFIPLRLDDAPIKGSVAQFSYVNWNPPERDQEYAKLLGACRKPGEPKETPKEKLRGRIIVIEFVTVTISLLGTLKHTDRITIRNGGTLWVDVDATIGTLCIGDTATHGNVLFEAGRSITLSVFGDVVFGPNAGNSLDLSFLGASGVLKMCGNILGYGGGNVRISSGKIDYFGAPTPKVHVIPVFASPVQKVDKSDLPPTK